MTMTPAVATSSPAEIPAQPTPFTPTFTRDMLVVHQAFRREFRLLPQLVRATPTADLARARVVADHLDVITELLHHHHGGEDRLLWPQLLARVGQESAPSCC